MTVEPGNVEGEILRKNRNNLSYETTNPIDQTPIVFKDRGWCLEVCSFNHSSLVQLQTPTQFTEWKEYWVQCASEWKENR